MILNKMKSKKRAIKIKYTACFFSHIFHAKSLLLFEYYPQNKEQIKQNIIEHNNSLYYLFEIILQLTGLLSHIYNKY